MEAATSVLREPKKRETRLGWWFMRTFRPKTVAVRTSRNELIASAWLLIEAYDGWELSQSPEAGMACAQARDRLCRAFDAYSRATDA